MTYSPHFKKMSGEMAHCPPSKSKKEIDIRANTDEVKDLATTLLEKVRDAKSLHNVVPPKPLSPYWAILTGTSWKVTSPKVGQLQTICAVALEETQPEVLQARESLLSSKHIMDLRFELWLRINLWLRWNRTTIFGASKSFDYWDQIPDQTVDCQSLYGGETAEKLSKLMIKDMQLLKELGDFLTTFPGLTNNRDAARSRRVISSESKSKIDDLIDVSVDGRRCPLSLN